MFKKVMKQNKILLTLLLGLAFSQVFAQPVIKKYTINNGGGKMTGDVYQMTASIGQTDVSNTLTGDNYSLNGGFWHKKDTTPQSELIFTNGFE